MAKCTRTWNENVYRRYIREGRGQGTGADYKPWLTVRDFPSLGVVSRVKGQKTGRIYHLMSTNETSLFYSLDWSDDVLDIREQYPLLNLAEVIGIAEKARLRYPYDNKSGFPYVMTSDFFVETTSGVVVLSVKPSSELEKPRVLEKSLKLSDDIGKRGTSSGKLLRSMKSIIQKPETLNGYRKQRI